MHVSPPLSQHPIGFPAPLDLAKYIKSIPIDDQHPDYQSNELFPTIMMVDRRVICNGRSLDLSRRPMTLQLFQMFFRAAAQTVNRDEIIREIYLAGEQLTTPRFRNCLKGNAVKLVSRARHLATQNLGIEGLEWFVNRNDGKSSEWCLFRLKNEYIRSRIGYIH